MNFDILMLKTTRSVFCHPSIFRQFEFGVLDLSENKISNIKQNTFSHLKLLRNLNLGHLKIAAMQPNAFPSRSIEFKKLNLDGNEFSEVP